MKQWTDDSCACSVTDRIRARGRRVFRFALVRRIARSIIRQCRVERGELDFGRRNHFGVVVFSVCDF